MPRKALCALFALALALAAPSAAPQAGFTYTPAIEAALGRISADNLRGNLSFLASDLLEGRDTPSPGLDVAAEYIAAQFRKARLEPAGNDGYFQNAAFLLSEARPETFELTFENGSATVTVRDVTVQSAAGLNIERAGAAIAGLERDAPLPEAAEAAGKVLFTVLPKTVQPDVMRRVQALRALKPALLVTLDRSGRSPRRGAPRRLVDAAERAAGAPWVVLRDEALAKALEGDITGAVVSARMEAPAEKPLTLRNVVGVLRGSDPALAGECVLVTAHYDHVGRQPGCTEGDCILNGANDNASGTVSLFEIAGALAALERAPRRSIVFAAFFGEERGFLGSRYYARNPAFPLAKTVANVNLEQLGRTDGDEGAKPGAANFTGFTYSDLPRVFQAAGELTGIDVHNSGPGNRYFGQSDNIVFAQAGIPAHTVSVAYIYPDYHRVSDHWDKIDYENMARVNRMLALGVLMLAESPGRPRWNETEPATAPYRRQSFSEPRP